MNEILDAINNRVCDDPAAEEASYRAFVGELDVSVETNMAPDRFAYPAFLVVGGLRVKLHGNTAEGVATALQLVCQGVADEWREREHLARMIDDENERLINNETED